MPSVILGAIFGFTLPAWYLLVILALVHGGLMGLRKRFKKPDSFDEDLERERERLAAEGKASWPKYQVPLLELVTEAIVFLVIGSIAYSIRAWL